MLKRKKLLFVLFLLLHSPAGLAGEGSRSASGTPRGNSSESELTRARNEVVQKMRETREGAEKLLALHEIARQRSAEEYEQRRELYYQGLISRNEVLQAEHLLAEAITRVKEDKRWLAESDMALTEFAMRDELLRLLPIDRERWLNSRTTPSKPSERRCRFEPLWQVLQQGYLPAPVQQR